MLGDRLEVEVAVGTALVEAVAVAGAEDAGMPALVVVVPMAGVV